MKQQALQNGLAFLFAASLFSFLSCKKEEEPGNTACKTCKAIGTTIVEKQVCSAAEEQAFRNENAGREISCR
jgi:hypothetical protein